MKYLRLYLYFTSYVCISLCLLLVYYTPRSIRDHYLRYYKAAELNDRLTNTGIPFVRITDVGQRKNTNHKDKPEVDISQGNSRVNGHRVSLNDNLNDNVIALFKIVNEAKKDTSNDEYISIVNIIRSDHHVDNERLTKVFNISWCSHCSDNHLQYIPKLAAFWDGPISVAVFTYGSKISDTLRYMTALHHCDANVKRRVSFHLCVPIRGMGQFMSTIDDDRQMINMSCNFLPKKENELSINFANKQVTYPINILRNMAMKNAYTEYVLPIDIDILPSMSVNGKFLNFIKTHVEPKTAFILPVFETNVLINATVTRNTLIEMWDRGTVRPFHHNFCRHCHAHTDYQRWKSIQVGRNLSVGYYRDWKQYWEPYLITRRDEVPDYNETFKGYGFDRMSQMCELYMSGFKFAVLDDGFLIHDGFKERRSTYKNRTREIAVYRVFYTDFKRILLKRYPNTGRKLPLTW